MPYISLYLETRLSLSNAYSGKFALAHLSATFPQQRLLRQTRSNARMLSGGGCGPKVHALLPALRYMPCYRTLNPTDTKNIVRAKRFSI